MWILYLNPMRGRCEDLQAVARADTKEALQQFMERERVDRYDDYGDHVIVHDTDFIAKAAGGEVSETIQGHRWAKCYKKGGPLEWFNPPTDENLAFERASLDEAINQAVMRITDNWNRNVMSLPLV